MRRVLPWLVAVVVLVVLWPTLCVSQEGGPTSCRSAVSLPLPWGESADTWGMVTAVVAAVVIFSVVRATLRRLPTRSRSA
jgi:hypothetical protein